MNPSASESAASKIRLLLIEDDYDVAEMLQVYFRSHQYELYHAESGLVGVQTARLRFPHLILLDVMLPDMDGYEVVRQLRQLSFTRYIPIIFLTQRDERANRIKGLNLGADDYIIKPFDIDELRLRVEKSIKRATSDSLHEARTGLPTGVLVEDELLTHAGGAHSVLRFVMHGFTLFGDVYGFLAANMVMEFAARTLQGVVSELGSENDFVGITDDQFVVITHASDADALDAAIQQRFADGVGMFYNFRDVEQGGMLVQDGDGERLVPLMTLERVTD